ncbi:MAG TPA: ABC transporter permease subunit, partial [Bacteroidota bacterium]|nr:ABC transporter permease subunit [Bacteroidota bacterium]
MRTVRWYSLVLLLAMGFVYIGYVLYPLLMTLAESLRADRDLTLGVYVSLFNPAHMEALLNSVFVSIVSVFCSGVLGLTFAVVFTQCDFPLRRLLSKLVIIPLALPPLVGVIAFLFVFGESGILPRLLQNLFALEKPPFLLDGIPAIVAVHTYSFNVYFYLLASAALRQLDASVLEAAEAFGSSSMQTFRSIIFPELKPAMLSASVLTFMTSMASFSA